MYTVLYTAHHHRGNTKMRTCAFDRVITAQNGCQRIRVFDQAIIVNDTGDLAIQ